MNGTSVAHPLVSTGIRALPPPKKSAKLEGLAR